MCATLSVVLALMAVLFPLPAMGNAWVLPKGKSVLGLALQVNGATSEFLPDGKLQRYPLNGQFTGIGMQLDGRYGFGHNLEFHARVVFKHVLYQADPVILPSDPPAQGLAEHRAGVFDFTRSTYGLADVFVGASYQHLAKPIRLASVLEVKFPTGYRSPAGTFSKDDPVASKIADDVTRGDGQLDLVYRLQFGAVLPWTKTIIQLDGGYRARFNGPGHQALAGAKVGQILGRYVVLLAGVDGAFTLFEGEELGMSYVAIDPRVSARDFTLDNIETIDLRLDRSNLAVFGGAILRFGGREWVLRFEHTVYGRNYARTTGGSLAVYHSFGG